MSTDIKGKKRKSGDDAIAKVSKKSKTVKSAEQSAPVKSAMKKSKPKASETVQASPKPKSVIETKTNVVRVNGKLVENSKKVVKKVNGKVVEKAVEEPFPAFSEEDSDNDENEGGAALSVDQTAALIAGFSSDESDDEGEDAEGIDISTLPTAPTSAIEAIASADFDPETTPGVILLKRIPHGFYEKQMRAYLSQFGTITNLRLARNSRTGKSQHSAWIEFASSAVARIVARTMDQYLLFGHLLQAKVVPREQVKENVWNQAKKPGRPLPRNKIERGEMRRAKTGEVWNAKTEKENKRLQQMNRKMKEDYGYTFPMPTLKGVEGAIAGGKKAQEEKVAEIEVQPVVEIVTAVVDESKKAPKKRKSTGEETVEKSLKKKKKAVTKK